MRSPLFFLWGIIKRLRRFFYSEDFGNVKNFSVNEK